MNKDSFTPGELGVLFIAMTEYQLATLSQSYKSDSVLAMAAAHRLTFTTGALKKLCAAVNENKDALKIATDPHFKPADPPAFKDPKYWSGIAPTYCDACDAKIKGVFYDARIGEHWGTVCPECFKRSNGRLGAGFGQQYTNAPDGRWVKTGG